MHTQVPCNANHTKTLVQACQQTVLAAVLDDFDLRHQRAVINHDKWMDLLDLK